MSREVCGFCWCPYGALDTLSGRNAAYAIRERLGLGQED